MPETKDLQELGQDTVAKAIAKAEGTTIAKAKDKMKKAKEAYLAKH